MKTLFNVVLFLSFISNFSYSEPLETQNYEGVLKVQKDLEIGTEIWNSKKTKMKVLKEFQGVQTIKYQQVFCRFFSTSADKSYDIILKNGAVLRAEVDRLLWRPDGLTLTYEGKGEVYTFKFDCGYQSQELGWENMDADLELYSKLAGEYFDFSNIRKKPSKILE